MASKELYIGNVDPDTKPQEIREIFELHGNVSRCEVKLGGLTHSAAFGFVGFESSDDAERAQRQESGRSLRGRRLIVQFTKTKAGQNQRRDRVIGLDRTENRNSNERDKSRSHNRYDSRDRYQRRRRRSPSYSRKSTRDRSNSDDRHRKRDRSRSSSNHKSSSKRLRLSSNDDKHRNSYSHKNGNSKKR